jgi:hypothetical protein
MTNPSCNNCIFSRIPKEFAPGHWSKVVAAELECSRFPDAVRVKPANWCGEYRPRPEAPPRPIPVISHPDIPHYSPLGAGVLDPDCF